MTCLRTSLTRESAAGTPLFVKTHGMSHTRLYQRWHAMVRRCTQPKFISYANYGGRGIKVCDRWLKFENFYADMGEPLPGQSLEREKNDGNYEKGNCSWVTRAVQSRNTRRSVKVTHEGVELTIRDWEMRKGVRKGAFQRRVDLGWDLLSVITQPIRPGKPLRTRL